MTLHNASLVLIYILSAMENKFFFIFSGQRKPLKFFCAIIRCLMIEFAVARGALR